MLTIAEVRSQVDNLKANHRDAEGAHSAEDNLYFELLTAIASGTCEDPMACAKIAIETQELDFDRWCA